MSMMKVFSERLKELRSDKKISAKTLGKAIGVSDTSIIRWENMQRVPSAENLYNLALYFGVTTDYLVGLEN